MSMTKLRVASAPRQYPLLYWTTMAFIVGIPNFIHFDDTGRTANAINLTSISLVVHALITGYLLVLTLLLDRKSITPRKIHADTGLWIALMLELLLATFLEPHSRLTPPTTMALLLSLFRIGQWVVAFVLVIALYSRTPAKQATQLVVELIGRSSWIWLAMVWIILPFMPSQVYGGSEDAGADTVKRLGGQLIHPAHVALLGSFAFFYAVYFFRSGPRKWLACFIALVSIVLTGARAQQAGFLLALLIYAIVLAKKPAIRLATIGILLVASLLGLTFSDKVVGYISRGQSMQTLSSLNDRTRVWQASFDAIRMRPILGYGYSIGARNAIKDHWTFAHWIPPHAHNEFIQAALDGGVIALVLFLLIYGRVFIRSVRDAGKGPQHAFLFLVFLQFCLNTATGPELGQQYHGTGGVLILCCVGILAGAAQTVRSRRTVPQTAGPALATSFHASSV